MGRTHPVLIKITLINKRCNHDHQHLHIAH